MGVTNTTDKDRPQEMYIVFSFMIKKVGTNKKQYIVHVCHYIINNE